MTAAYKHQASQPACTHTDIQPASVTTHAYQLLHRLGAHAKRYAYLHLRPTNTALGTMVPRSLRVSLATPHPTVIALSVSLLPLELEREQENAAIDGAYVK